MHLTIYPMFHEKNFQKGKLAFRDRLIFDLDYRIYGQLKEYKENPSKREQVIYPREVPEGFEIISPDETDCDRAFLEQAYKDKKFTFLFANELRRLTLSGSETPRNNAIIAYINQLPDWLPILLYWS